MHEHARHEARKLIQFADEEAGEGHEADDLAHRDLAAGSEPTAYREDRDHSDRGGGAREDIEQSPPRQHGILSGKELIHQIAQGSRFCRQAPVALHDRDVADHVAHPAENVDVIPLDRRLPVGGAVDDRDVQDNVDHRQNGQQAGQSPVHVNGCRNQEQNADDCRKLLAHECQPGGEQGIRAREYGANRGPRSALGQIADRQRQCALKGAAHRGEPLAMREPVGCDCDQDAGENAKQPKHGPKENELEHGVAARKAVYDTTEKDRLSERDKCNADVG